MVKQTPKGHKYIEVSLKQMVGPLKGLGICDSCCVTQMSTGFLIPVLNSVYCKECFDQWNSEAKFYKEDVDYENMKTQQFVHVLKGSS